MTSPQADPPAQALGESLAALAAQIAALRGQITLINQRLDRAGISGDLDLAARFEELARTVADTLDAAAPTGPAAPCWIGLDRQAHAAQLAELRQWADIVLRQHYGGYELRDCWPSHIHAIWELSTLAAEWHHIYGGRRPDLGRALEFYDRWLPGTMRRTAGITRACVPECVTRHRAWRPAGSHSGPGALSNALTAGRTVQQPVGSPTGVLRSACGHMRRWRCSKAYSPTNTMAR
ncbi:MAG: hypothetical protein ACRDOH_06995 [Streptosporangiaceae bacterium]